MQGDSAVSGLMFFTLIAAVFIIAGSFIYFLRSRHSREVATVTLQGDGSPHQGTTPHGAGAELIGFAVLAIAVMALLATGYHGKPSAERAQLPPLVGGTTTGMAQAPGTANQPKPYQPANPAPDPRAAPTSSDTGVGPDNGSTGAPTSAGAPK